MSDDEAAPLLPPPALASRYTSALHEALSVTERAVQSDSGGDAREALRLYSLAVSLFRQALSEEGENEELLATIPAKMREYERRVEALQRELQGGQEAKYADLDIEFYQEKGRAKRKEGDVVDDFDEPHSLSQRKRVAPKGRRGEKALELALRLAYTAKNLAADAFACYTRALEAYAEAAQHAPSGILTSLNRAMKELMVRAEELKQSLPPLPPASPAPPSPSLSTKHDISRLEGVDLRLGPLTGTTSTRFWNDAAPLTMRVAIERNVVPTGVNVDVRVFIECAAKIKVGCLKLALRQWMTKVLVLPSRRVQRSLLLHPLLYRNPSRFPLRGPCSFKGLLRFPIPDSVAPTVSDESASGALEYELVVEAHVALHEDVSLALPLHICAS